MQVKSFFLKFILKVRMNRAEIVLASNADVLRLVTRSSPRTRDKPKNVCVGG